MIAAKLMRWLLKLAPPWPRLSRSSRLVMEIIELATDEIEAAELGQVDLVRAALARWGNL
jgi:hypothetical protein